MAAVSRIRDPQRLVELVADTMARESAHASRSRRLRSPDAGRPVDSPVEVPDSPGHPDEEAA
jgi:hypothetical protein